MGVDGGTKAPWKVWSLAIKGNRKTEPRNPHSQPQREENSGKQIKHTDGNTYLQNVQLPSSYSRLQHRDPDIPHRHDGVL